jgi:hypothetical protein
MHRNNVRLLAFILFCCAAALPAGAAGTNYICVVCGKGPLSGHIWLSKWGAICTNCMELENRCSICGLPVREGDGHAQTGDGRFICKFDRPTAVLDAAAAREVFADTRRRLAGLFGTGFALQYPAVTVNLFDVDYWSEKGRENSLHKFGFSSTRKTASGKCTHEVVLLSGRPRNELAATAAHEYTHLWINENLPKERELDADTTEAVCELVSYLLMGAERQPDMQKRILENPYTNGKIKTLLALEEQRGLGFVLNWVKAGTSTNLESVASAALLATPARPQVKAAPGLPNQLQFTGRFVIGTNQAAIINGTGFEAGDRKFIRLRNRTAVVICRKIGERDVLVESNGVAVTLPLEPK